MMMSAWKDALRAPRRGQRVCIVDDDSSVRNALARFLRAADLAVTTFASAAELLACEGCGTFDCAILDVRMPGMDGLALQRSLSARGSRPFVIFLTAHEDDSVRERALRNGAAAFLLKPASGHELLAAVHAALG